MIACTHLGELLASLVSPLRGDEPDVVDGARDGDLQCDKVGHINQCTNIEENLLIMGIEYCNVPASQAGQPQQQSHSKWCTAAPPKEYSTSNQQKQRQHQQSNKPPYLSCIASHELQKIQNTLAQVFLQLPLPVQQRQLVGGADGQLAPVPEA